MQSTDILVSVALLTRNGPPRLATCLESIRAQSAQPHEIVVSDDSDSDFVEQNRAIAERYGCRYLSGPRRGLYANRNAAALACTGTHIRSVDDDHTFPEGHFALCLAAVASDPEAIWTTGEFGFVDGKFSTRADTANQLDPSGLGIRPIDRQDNWTISDGSTYYPASVFQRGFRMIENFNYGSSYLEFGAFLYHHGYRSRCIEGALVNHNLESEALARNRAYHSSKVWSCIYAILAYNFFFKPNFIGAARHLLSALWHCGFDPAVICKLPSIARAVGERWSKRVGIPASH